MLVLLVVLVPMDCFFSNMHHIFSYPFTNYTRSSFQRFHQNLFNRKDGPYRDQLLYILQCDFLEEIADKQFKGKVLWF